MKSCWLALVFALAILPGCATTGLLSKFSGGDRIAVASASDPAVRCLCVWQTAEGTDPEGRSCRGVAGQVFFFTKNNNPVAVDGLVKVYVFDDQGSEQEQVKPISQFDVDSATWNSKLAKSQFGPAYQVFVPYTRPGRHQAEMAVRIKMVPVEGRPVFSDLAKIRLEGSDGLKKQVDTATAIESPSKPRRPIDQAVTNRSSQGPESENQSVLIARQTISNNSRWERDRSSAPADSDEVARIQTPRQLRNLP